MTESKLFFMNTYSIHFDWLTVVNHMNIKPRPFLCRGLSQRQDIENYIQSVFSVTVKYSLKPSYLLKRF